MRKIDWDKVWNGYDVWFSRPRKEFLTWFVEKKKIQALVEAQLKRKKHGKDK